MTINEIDLVKQAGLRLRAEGGRMTAQRRLILEVLNDYPGHPTAEEVFLRVRESDPSLNLSTVYRTLRWLESQGLVNPRWFENDRRQERFDPVTNDDVNHHHFRCRICNQIIEFSDPLIERIKSAYETRHGGQVESVTLVLYGKCAECQSVNDH